MTHGTSYGYKIGCRCGDCRRAAVAAKRRWRDKARAEGAPILLSRTRSNPRPERDLSWHLSGLRRADILVGHCAADQALRHVLPGCPCARARHHVSLHRQGL